MRTGPEGRMRRVARKNKTTSGAGERRRGAWRGAGRSDRARRPASGRRRWYRGPVAPSRWVFESRGDVDAPRDAARDVDRDVDDHDMAHLVEGPDVLRAGVGLEVLQDHLLDDQALVRPGIVRCGHHGARSARGACGDGASTRSDECRAARRNEGNQPRRARGKNASPACGNGRIRSSEMVRRKTRHFWDTSETSVAELFHFGKGSYGAQSGFFLVVTPPHE